VSDRIKDTNDPNLNFLIFQQSRMEKEINNLRHELGKSSMISRFNSDSESFAIKSKETYSIELKNCLKISSDIRNEMSSNVLSLEDKLRQTQVRTGSRKIERSPFAWEIGALEHHLVSKAARSRQSKNRLPPKNGAQAERQSALNAAIMAEN